MIVQLATRGRAWWSWFGKDFVQGVVEVLTGCSEADFAEDLEVLEVFAFFAIRSRVGQFCDHGAYGDEFAETRSHFFLGFSQPRLLQRLGSKFCHCKAWRFIRAESGGLARRLQFPYLLVDATGLSGG